MQLNYNLQKQPITDGIPICYAFWAGHLDFSVWQGTVTDSHGFLQAQILQNWGSPNIRSIVSQPVQADSGKMWLFGRLRVRNIQSKRTILCSSYVP